MANQVKQPRRLMRQRRVGVPPGTLEAHPGAHEPTIRVLAYGKENYIEEPITDLSQLPALTEQWAVTWVNVDGLGSLDVIQTLGDMFELHRLALEDVLHLGQRPKVEEYTENLFLVLRMLEKTRRLETEQLSVFLGKKFVVTFQEHPGDCLESVRDRIREQRGRVREMGADYLVYCIMDAVIDAYFPFLDALSERIEDLEEDVVVEPTQKTASAIHLSRRELLTLRRTVAPLREMLSTILRDGHELITEGTFLYLRDCYDHVIQLMDMIDSNREIVSGLLDVYLSSVSNRMNEIMKVLTIIATIFIPLSFVVGLYGMNFDGTISAWNMPELRWRYGYPIVLAILLVIVLVQLVFFWRKGWIFARKHDDDEA